MNLKEILAISGYSGLFKYVSQGKNGIIVEGLEDKKRMNAYAHYKVSSLDDIAIFSDSGEIPLREIFKKISVLESGGETPSFKSDDKKLKEYSKTANIPGFRKGMVPPGVIKKMYGNAILSDEVIRSVEKELNNYLVNEKPDIFAQPLPILNEMDKMDESLPEMRSFVMPGGHTTVSYCHIARCVCRRAERNTIHLAEENFVDLQ